MDEGRTDEGRKGGENSFTLWMRRLRNNHKTDPFMWFLREAGRKHKEERIPNISGLAGQLSPDLMLGLRSKSQAGVVACGYVAGNINSGRQ